MPVRVKESTLSIRMFYVTLLIARLVSLYSSKSPLEVANHEKILDQKRFGFENSQTTSNNPEE